VNGRTLELGKKRIWLQINVNGVGRMKGCVFSPDGINQVRGEITWTRLVSFGIKKRRKQFRPVYLDVASRLEAMSL